MSTVLVVDDQADAREMLVEYLAFCGFQVTEAVDGLEAIEIALRAHPGVILMDLMMPRLDGWEATRRLKADPRTTTIPIAAVSACAHVDDQERARNAGCEVVLAKPVDLDQLTLFVTAALKRFH